MIEFKMLSVNTDRQGRSYSVSIEEFMKDAARLTLSCEDGNAESKNHLEMELSSEECESLGEHLLLVAKRLKVNTK